MTEKPTLLELARQALSGTERGYDLLAPKFDATSFRTPDEIVARALDVVGEVESAVDLCCGTGAALSFLRPLVRDRLVGVDFSRGMLDVARDRLAALSAPEGAQLELVRSELFAWRDPSAEAAFDVVTCFGAFGHVLEADERRFVALVRRLLRPGGRFVFVTTDAPPLLSKATLVGRGFNLAMHVRNAILSPPFVMYYLTFLLPRCARLLEEGGFAVTADRAVFEGPYRGCVRVVARRVDR